MAEVAPWGDTYEAEPANTATPRGWSDIQSIKVNLRSRLEKFHYWSLSDDSAKQGFHKPGSTKVYYESSAPTDRPDGSTTLDTDDEGRLWHNTTDGGMYYWTGTAFGKCVDNDADSTTYTESATETFHGDAFGTQDRGAFSLVTGTNFYIAHTWRGSFWDLVDQVDNGEPCSAPNVDTRYYKANVSENTVFDDISPDMPSTLVKYPIFGGFRLGNGDQTFVLDVYKGSNYLFLEGIRFDTSSSTFTDNIYLVNDGDSTSIFSIFLEY
jgi:hypothetical protein